MLAVAALLWGGGAARAGGPAGRPIFDPSRDPALDLVAAEAEARADDKRILLEVGGNWCGWCREFERFVRAEPEVRDAFACDFVVLRVNVSPENRNEAFLSRYPEIPGYPYFFVLDRDGKLLRALDADELLRGDAYDRRKVLAFLRASAGPAQEPGTR